VIETGVLPPDAGGRTTAKADNAREPWLDPNARPFIRILGVTKRFGQFTAVDDVSLDIFKGELFALLGGSGCGKTTLLRVLAGFEQPTKGQVFIDGEDMTEIPPYERPVNMMFQSYALFPHMTVAKNVGYGLKHEAMSDAQRRDRVQAMLDLVQLAPLAERKPHQLSGGQRQRVALARALAKQPKLLLLDEPLGALDKKLREHTQFEIMNIQRKTGITFVVVTHDQEEAMTLASRIAVMDKGVIRQIGTPTEIYEYPRSRFVADFIGSINLFEGTVKSQQGALTRIFCPSWGDEVVAHAETTLASGTPVAVAVRPEKITLDSERPPGGRNHARGQIVDHGYFGKDSLYRVRLASGELVRVNRVNDTRAAESEIRLSGREVWLSFAPAAAIVLDRA
jgi:putrescine transport system ATP-binding protein